MAKKEKIKEISIERFRGIKLLKMEHLKRVNVFLGKNNCGKSSALEAILVLMGAAKATLPIEINQKRNYKKCEKNDFALFFYNLTTNEPIEIRATFTDEVRRELYIKYYEKGTTNIPIDELQNKGIDTKPNFTYGLNFEYTDGDEKYRSSIEAQIDNKDAFKVSRNETEMTRNLALYISPQYDFDVYISKFNEIITDKEKENVLSILRRVEPKIQDVVVVDKIVMVDVGLTKFIPINVLGDGIRKLFTLIVAMHHAKGGILIIDEVDNGLYHESMQVLWNALLYASVEFDVQIFASTHSIDSLNSLNDVLTSDHPNLQDDVKIYTLRRDAQDVITTYSFDYATFSHLLNQEVDIR